jgi:hypothetical protein
LESEKYFPFAPDLSGLARWKTRAVGLLKSRGGGYLTSLRV